MDEKARDFDDAISITAFKNGGFLLGVHIADVAALRKRRFRT